MIACAKTSQLHLFSILNLLCIAIAPLYRHFWVRVCVDENVESAVAGVELREKSHGGGNLTEDGLDFELDLFFGFWLGGQYFAETVFRRAQLDGRDWLTLVQNSLYQEVSMSLSIYSS